MFSNNFSFKGSMESDNHSQVCQRSHPGTLRFLGKIQRFQWTLLVVGNGYQATCSVHKRHHNTTNLHSFIYKCVLGSGIPDPKDIRSMQRGPLQG